MNADLDRHFPAEVWEEYVLGMRSEEDCKLLEEHLLICSTCQDLLVQADEYIRIMKAALAQDAPADPGGKPVTGAGSRKSLSKPFKASAALAGGMLLAWGS